MVEECKPGNAPRLLFSAMDASVATEIEQAFAQAGHVVVSNSKNHRMERDVPLLVPEINPDHLKLIPGQQRARGWKGQIVTNPNCSTIVLTMGLAPLKQFGITQVIATTLQAISGAGYPGVPSMDINANVIPFIGGEEEKMEQETQKILGEFARRSHRAAGGQGERALQSRAGGGRPHWSRSRWSFRTSRREADLMRAFDKFAGVPQQRELPSAPAKPVIYMAQHDRPQPRRDVERERGMAAFVGRSARVPGARLQVRRAGPQHGSRRGGRGGAQRRADALGRDAGLNLTMIVMKFGGTSVESAAAIETRRVALCGRARDAPAGGGGVGDGQDHQQAAGDRRRGHRAASATNTSRRFTTCAISTRARRGWWCRWRSAPSSTARSTSISRN